MAQTPIPQPPALDLSNIQGDILSGLPKKTQYYIFFTIKDVTKFRSDLVRFIPLVKTVAQVLKDRDDIAEHKRHHRPGLIPLVGVNISISHFGFAKIGIDDSTLAPKGKEDVFTLGQKQDAITNLGDPKRPDGQPDWDEAFLKEIHGVILISGDSHHSIDKTKRDIDHIFGCRTHHASIEEVKVIRGDVRPGDESAHEHFGFLDGISNPTINGFEVNPNPGPNPVDPGVVLVGQTGDPTPREDWAKDGSFLAFRYLSQLVPEFDTFLHDHPVKKDGNGKDLTHKEGSELLGARMVGRWKSGAPIDITPFHDDPVLAKDPKRNNDFKFEGEITSQFKCPFAAHVRKTMPRDDLESRGISVAKNRILRRGVQFGPEVTRAEHHSGKTSHDRGLLFACYQSHLENGFQFLQQSWADNVNFPPFTGGAATIGLDPLIGQGDRAMSGLDPLNLAVVQPIDIFIVPRGGEYFFSPSIKALKENIATGVSIQT